MEMGEQRELGEMGELGELGKQRVMRCRDVACVET